jgi:hypothetical protein
MVTQNLPSGGVSIVGIGQDVRPTMFLNAAVVAADAGKLVKLDSANNTVTLAADGDVALGVLVTYENRTTEGIKTGAIGLKGGYRFTYVTGDAVAVGESIVAAPAGEVKRTATANNSKVFAKNTIARTVDVWFS